jgi:hypothetical protein
MRPGDGHEIDRDIRIWLDPGGGITIKAVTAEGDPVELSAAEARRIAAVLIEFADADEAD